MQRARSICFTLNNYTEDEYNSIKTYCEQNARYAIVGKEVGASGTPHLQGYVNFANPRSFTAIKRGLGNRVHLERARGSASQNKEYCSKDGDFWETGECPVGAVGDISSAVEKRKLLNERIMNEDLKCLVDLGEIHISQVPLLKKAKMVLEQEKPAYEADGCRGIWYWGNAGVGKSRLVRSLCEDDFYLKQQNKWWDGYIGQKNVILDDFDLKGDGLSHHLKIWTDRYACTGEIKGGMVNLRHHKFYITSNYPPERFWPDDMELLNAIRRRFDVIHMTNLQ